MQNLEQKKNWTPTPEAFRRFLVWLDDGEADSEGRKYLEMRERLAAYFDRKNCLAPDELADETLNRAARRLEEEGGAIETDAPAKFCYTLARFVFLEYLRRKEKDALPLEEVADKLREKNLAALEDEAKKKEKMLVCLEQCAAKLEAASRDLIFGYYRGEERVKIDNRRRLAESLGITPNALSIRACRIREKLALCVRKCAGESEEE